MNQKMAARVAMGMIILAVGVVAMLNALHITVADNLVNDYWPLAIVVVGVLIFLNNIRSWPVAVFAVALGGLYQLRIMDVIDVEPWPIVWALIIMLVGVSVLFGRSYTGKRVSKADRDDVSAILAGANVTSSTKRFKQSNVTTIMGGAQLDLRDADFDKDALVDVFAFWGGVEIIVPENVVIRNQVNNILAGTEDKTQQKTTKTSPTLVIAGTALMGGVSIRNTPSN